MAGRVVYVVCGIVVAAALVAAGVDFALTSASVDPVPATCPVPGDVACQQARNQQLQARLTDKQELEDDFALRAWAYALAVVAAMAVALRQVLRGRSGQERRRLLTTLGVAGVGLGLLTTAALLFATRATLALPTLPAFLPTLALLATAGVGGLAARGPAGPEPRGGLARAALWGGLGCTALTVLVAVVAAIPDSDCGSGDGAPEWAERLYGVIFIPALAAFAFGLLALAVRRWVVALVSIAVSPVVVLFLAADMCAFY